MLENLFFVKDLKQDADSQTNYVCTSLHKWNYGPVLLWTAAANFQILSQASHINLEMSVIQFEISQENGVHCLLQIDYELLRNLKLST